MSTNKSDTSTNPIAPALLRGLNITQLQAKVYFAALELGQSNIQDLSRKSGVKRTSIYNFIQDLKERGLLLETTKKNRRLYSAMHPEQLLEMEKARIAELQHAIPELLAIHNGAKNKPRVTFYEGVQGIEEVYADMLKEGKPIFAYEDLEHMKAGMRSSFYDSWPDERAKRNIPFKSITRDSPVARDFMKTNIRRLRKSKFIESPDLKTEINIYGDKVAMMSFRKDAPFCVLIEDRGIAETLGTTWQQLWDKLGPVVG